jgi:hypothetical protein
VIVDAPRLPSFRPEFSQGLWPLIRPFEERYGRDGSRTLVIVQTVPVDAEPCMESLGHVQRGAEQWIVTGGGNDARMMLYGGYSGVNGLSRLGIDAGPNHWRATLAAVEDAA